MRVESFFGLSARARPVDGRKAPASARCGPSPRMAALVREWSRDRPECLREVIWYWLPVVDDSLNWSWPTLEAVLAGQSPHSRLRHSFDARARDWSKSICTTPAPPIARSGVVELHCHGARVIASDGLLGFESIEVSANALRFVSLSLQSRAATRRDTDDWLGSTRSGCRDAGANSGSAGFSGDSRK